MQDSYVIFTGRPNAGKSSMINALTGLKLPTGKRPGTTTDINEYPIANGLVLADMPGYGTKLGASKGWEDMTKEKILDFIFNNRDSIVLCVHVLNITTFIETTERLAKKGFVNLDMEMVNYIYDTVQEFPLVAANKIDKSSEQEVIENLEAFLEMLSTVNPIISRNNVYPISAKKGTGIGQLKDTFYRTLVSKGWRNPFEYIR
jgi:GTP-binding protein EngB required for normal cell division